MSKVHGQKTFLSLNGVDLSPFSTKVDFDRTVDSHDITTFGNTTHVYGQGLLDGTISLEGKYDTTGPTATIVPLLTASPTPSFIHGPEGNATGKPKNTVLVNVTDFKTTNDVADYVMFTVELQMTGPVVTGTF